MVNVEPHIDPYLFQRHFEAFKAFVEEKSGIAFVSFASNPYTEEQEGYKYGIYRAGREALAFHGWTRSAIGSGKIAEDAINAIQLRNNNLVSWQPRYGDASRPHQPLFEARSNVDQLRRIESCLFRLYREQQDERSFAELIDVFGKRYPLPAYLFFLKDRSRYLPIAPQYLDRAFELLGAEFKASHQCSWDNYRTYVTLIGEVRTLLAERLGTEVSLLDAHSFTWMLAVQMERENKLADVQEYLDLPASERDAIVKARTGQGRFRDSLIHYWSTCAVTGVSEASLLRASHIKPWAQATLAERLSLYNGLLLSPALDACFDGGYVSFDDEGKILISERLTAEDAAALSIHADMRLRRMAPEHKTYLAYHRERVFE